MLATTPRTRRVRFDNLQQLVDSLGGIPASRVLVDPPIGRATVKDLLALQRKDGGWNLPSLADWKRLDGQPNDKNASSDGYATGLILYVLRQNGLPTKDDAIQRGVTWLKANQRASGRWFTRSVNADRAHYITNVGTAYAVMALHACGETDK